MDVLSSGGSANFPTDLYDGFLKFGKEGEIELMSFVRQTMFDSVVRQLFGSENMPQTEAGMRELEQKFVKFDQDFEYGTQLPEFLIRCIYAIPFPHYRPTLHILFNY